MSLGVGTNCRVLRVIRHRSRTRPAQWSLSRRDPTYRSFLARRAAGEPEASPFRFVSVFVCFLLSGPHMSTELALHGGTPVCRLVAVSGKSGDLRPSTFSSSRVV